MLEALLQTGNSTFSFPDTINYTDASSNFKTGTTSGVPSTSKRAGACYIDHNGDINVLGGIQSSITGQQILYKYNKTTNSLSAVSTFMTDSRYYLSATAFNIGTKRYVYALGYNTFDSFLSTAPNSKLSTPTTFGASGNFNHNLLYVKNKSNNTDYILNVRRSASNAITVYTMPVPTHAPLNTFTITIPTTTSSDSCVSAVYNDKVITYTGGNYVVVFDPFTKVSTIAQLSGNIGTIPALHTACNYAHVENDHFYCPYMNSSILLIINLKTFKRSKITYSTIFNNESANILDKGKIYSFFGGVTSYNVRDYPIAA